MRQRHIRVVRTLQNGFQNIDGAMDALGEMTMYFMTAVMERRSMEPGTRPDDIITMLIEAETDEPITDQHLLGTCFLLLVAGIDTTWSNIGSSLLHLATHPEDQQRLRDEPDLIPTAVEEFPQIVKLDDLGLSCSHVLLRELDGVINRLDGCGAVGRRVSHLPVAALDVKPVVIIEDHIGAGLLDRVRCAHGFLHCCILPYA